MFRDSRAVELKEGGESTADLAAALVRDKRFRTQLAGAAAHSLAARKRAGSSVGTAAVAVRLARDEALRRELGEMIDNLSAAWARGAKKKKKKKSHRMRNALLLSLATAAAVAAAVPPIRRRLQSLRS